jgi:predicted DNA-binding transcriptional regulator YafY
VNRTDRLYAIVEELRAAREGGRTAHQLAARFEVSARTIKRDVSALQQAGSPIWAGGGPGGGYILDTGAALPPLTFTPGETVALAAALAVDPGLPFGPDGKTALAKLLDAMTAEGREQVDQLAARLWVLPAGSPRGPVARVVDEAVRANVVVVIDYVDREGARTERRPVEPMAFAHRDRRWYLLAWCRRRRAGRWFRLDRISAATLTTQACPPRDLVEVFGDPPDDAAPVTVT